MAPRPREVTNALTQRQFARTNIELLVNRIYGLCGYEAPSAAVPTIQMETRAQCQEVHALINSSCPMCKNKYFKLSIRKYDQLMGIVPFTYAHNAAMSLLTIENPP